MNIGQTVPRFRDNLLFLKLTGFTCFLFLFSSDPDSDSDYGSLYDSDDEGVSRSEREKERHRDNGTLSDTKTVGNFLRRAVQGLPGAGVGLFYNDSDTDEEIDALVESSGLD